MLTRRTFVATAAASPLRPQSRRKPNFLFLIADDHAGYVMGCDGSRHAETPHIDRLAAEGTRFAANYCNSPVCTPSRQSILTGQMPHSAGVTVLRTSLDTEKPTIPKQLKKAGYETAVFGKMHLNRPDIPGLYGAKQARSCGTTGAAVAMASVPNARKAMAERVQSAAPAVRRRHAERVSGPPGLAVSGTKQE
jgi:arylsulfatase A-like enzyme